MTHSLDKSNPILAADLVALTKPRIALLALITAVAAFHLAPGAWQWAHLGITLFGMLLLVGGASALNMFLEREIDARMERTQTRPLPSQRLTPDLGLSVGALLVALALPIFFYGVNALTGWLGLLSLVLYVLTYTPMKRHSSLALWVGAVPGAMPPLMGWTAATGSLGEPGLILFGIVFLWQIPHFLAIGTFRREEYARAGFKIFPLQQKSRNIQWQMLLLTSLLFPLSLLLSLRGYAGIYYAVVACLLNVGFLGSVVWSFWEPQASCWGKKVFLASLIYLTVLFGMVFVDGIG